MGVFGVLGKGGEKFRTDSRPQLLGGGAGEGDDEKLVYVFFFPLDAVKKPLHQNTGLAGTGCR